MVFISDKSFDYLKGIEIIKPILQLIKKVSKIILAESYNLLSATVNVKAFHLTFLDMKTEIRFEKTFDTSASISKELDVLILLIN